MLKDRDHAGFTLLELIVAISILAILAGIAVPAYSGYVAEASREADRVLIGSILRAIETSAATGEIPEGTLVLTADGVEVQPVGYVKPCNIVTLENVTYLVTKQDIRCAAGTLFAPYQVAMNEPVRYCKDHRTVEPQVIELEEPHKYTSSWSSSRCSGSSKLCSSTWHAPVSGEIPAGTLYLSNYENLEIVAPGTKYCSQVKTSSMDSLVAPEDTALYAALVAAFGSDLSGLKLAGEWDDGEITVTVSVTDGVLAINVSPEAANPRNG